MEFSNTNHLTTTTPPLGSLMTMSTANLEGSINPMVGNSAEMQMDTVSGPLTAGVAGAVGVAPLVRRPSKKEREAEKRASFYLGNGQGSTQPRYLDWGTRFAHQYLHNFNTDNLGLFYDTGSTFTFINTLQSPSAVICHTSAESIYTYLQIFRELKQIHMGQNGLQVQPMTDHHSITLTLELNIEHQNGSMCHVIPTMILQTLPGKKTRRQIGDYQSCQYIQNQFSQLFPSV